MAGLNINSRQNSIHSSNKKYNLSLLFVIYLVFPLSAVLLALFFIYSEIYETIPLQLSEMFFFIVRSTDWLKLICARSLCMKIYDIAFQ